MVETKSVSGVPPRRFAVGRFVATVPSGRTERHGNDFATLAVAGRTDLPDHAHRSLSPHPLGDPLFFFANRVAVDCCRADLAVA